MSQQTFFTQSQSQSQANRNPNSRHPTCPRCGSRKWRRDPNRGAVVCAEGHVLEGFLRESTEQTEASAYSVRRRRLRVGPKVRKHYVLKSTYQGQQARILLLQAMTLLIRKQIEALIQVIKAPTQLEEIGRTLWKSYLSVLDLDDEIFIGPRSASPAGASSQMEEDPELIDMLSEDSASLSGKDHNKTQLDPESLKDIAHDNSQSSDDSLPSSAASSSSSSNDEILPDDSARQRYRRQVENIKVHPRMEVTICTLYLACLKLRIPIILQDIINLIITKQLPYLGFLHSLPSEFKQKMNRSVMETFWVEKPPRLFYRQDDNNGLFSVCHQLIKIFHDSNPPTLSPESTIPNLVLIVSRFSTVLLLPEPLQLLCMHLLEKLDSFCLDYNPLKRTSNSSANNRPQTSYRPPIGKRHVAKYPPEWFIMAVIYLVAHSAILSYSNSRRANLHSAADQTDNQRKISNLILDQLPKPSKWYSDLKKEIERDNDKNPQKLWEKNITDLDPREIDSYIELAKDFLLKDEPEANNISFKNHYFPLISQPRSDLSQPRSDVLKSKCGISQPRCENEEREVEDDQRDSVPLGLYDPSLLLENEENRPNLNSVSNRSYQLDLKEQKFIELLKSTLLNRASEFVGCSLANHSNLNEFIKVLSFVNSMLSKNL